MPYDPTIDSSPLVRFLSNECSPEEETQVKAWLQSDAGNQEYFEQLALLWKTSSDAAEFNTEWVESDWRKVAARTTNKVPVVNPLRESGHRQILINLSRIAAAIALVVVCYFVLQRMLPKISEEELYAVSSEVPLEVKLPDGSIVTLNAHSKLSYPKQFAGDLRTVKLQGEAFFDVSHNPEKPFIVEADSLFTRVVGTAFNLNASASITTLTVLSGKVLFYKKKNEALTLTKGESGTFSNHQLKETQVEGLNFLSWKTDSLVFINTALPTVIEDINRHFHSKIRVDSQELYACKLTTTFKHETLENVLDELQLLFNIQVERQGELVHVTGKGCTP